MKWSGNFVDWPHEGQEQRGTARLRYMGWLSATAGAVGALAYLPQKWRSGNEKRSDEPQPLPSAPTKGQNRTAQGRRPLRGADQALPLFCYKSLAAQVGRLLE